VEFIFAIVALHGGKRVVRTMLDRVANVALFETFCLFVDVALPHEYG
jgi:hypothetical protein